MKAIQTSAIAAAIALCTSSPLLAQTDRVYITGVGGFARSTDTTSGDAMAEVGVRIAPHLLAFGDVGRFGNLQPSDVQPSIAATTSQLSSSQGLAVIGTGSVPAWYSVGGLRFEVPLQGRVQPYVFGGAGFARLMPTAQFTLSSGTLPDGTSPAAGSNVTDQLETAGDFATPVAQTAFMYSPGRWDRGPGRTALGRGRGLPLFPGQRRYARQRSGSDIRNRVPVLDTALVVCSADLQVCLGADL
ncbi:MAG TPA: hypothetical protein VKB36_11085 [Vicinamibacterales bacterium]|nr:hypothetical protein [Vicinamibacterales bacterium]